MKSEWDDHVEKLADEVNENRCTVNAYVFTGRKPIVNEHENGLIDDELFSDDEMNENNALQRMKRVIEHKNRININDENDETDEKYEDKNYENENKESK